MFRDQLRAEMQAQHLSPAHLEKRLEKFEQNDGEAVPGKSRRSIENYLNGEQQPKPRFIEATARVLGVRYAYLASGEEPRTDHTALVAHATNTVAARARVVGVPGRSAKDAASTVALIQSLSPVFNPESGSATPIAALLDAWAKFSQSNGGATPADSRIPKKLVAMVRAPLQEKGMVPERQMRPEQRAAYYTAMLHALMLGMKDAGQSLR